MNRIIASVLLLVLLAGCGTYVTPIELEVRGDYCDNNEGVKYFVISATRPNVANVICNNGAMFKFAKDYSDE